MITLYKEIKSNTNFIDSVDLSFDKEIYSLNIADKDKYYMNVIDEAQYMGDGYINTPFGKTEIQNLSTGCKTLILLNHMRELNNPVINIGECGKNVLDIIFDMDNISVYLDYCSIPNNYDSNKIIKVISHNGVKEMKLRDVFNRLWRN